MADCHPYKWGFRAGLAAAAAAIGALAATAIVRLKDERDRARASEERALARERAAIAGREAAEEATGKWRATALAASKHFAMQAIRAAETGHRPEAERRVADAERVAVRTPWPLYARGVLARMGQDCQAAADRFREALRIDPEHAESQAALSEALARMGELEQAEKLAEGIGRVSDWRALLKLGEMLYEARRWSDCQPPLTRAIELMHKDAPSTHQAEVRMATARRLLETARAKAACVGFAQEIERLPLRDQIPRVQAKLGEIHGPELDVQGAVTEKDGWAEARFRGQKALRFLDPLTGLRLRVLDIDRTSVEDLAALKGSALRELRCCGTRVSDLGPLKGLPLTSLHCSETAVSDLSPLEGMRLTHLGCGGTRVTDLRPLRAMPLKQLDCAHTPVSDLSPLKGVPLGSLNCLDTAVRDLSPLQGLPLRLLNCHRTAVRDLGPLRGAPLRDLCFAGTRVADLSPLEGMPLVSLNCGRTPVSDLTPLAGMKLTTLHLPPREQLTAESLELIADLHKRGCKIVWPK